MPSLTQCFWKHWLTFSTECSDSRAVPSCTDNYTIIIKKRFFLIKPFEKSRTSTFPETRDANFSEKSSVFCNNPSIQLQQISLKIFFLACSPSFSLQSSVCKRQFIFYLSFALNSKPSIKCLTSDNIDATLWGVASYQFLLYGEIVFSYCKLVFFIHISYRYSHLCKMKDRWPKVH